MSLSPEKKSPSAVPTPAVREEDSDDAGSILPAIASLESTTTPTPLPKEVEGGRGRRLQVFSKYMDKDTVVLLAARMENQDSIDTVNMLADPKEVNRMRDVQTSEKFTSCHSTLLTSELLSLALIQMENATDPAPEQVAEIVDRYDDASLPDSAKDDPGYIWRHRLCYAAIWCIYC